MAPPLNFKPFCLYAVLAITLAGCSASPRQAVEDTVAFPARAVKKGVQSIGRGVGAIGRGANRLSGNLVGRLLLDRSRNQLLREHRQVSEHMANLTTYVQVREVPLAPNEKRVLQNARETLAAAGRGLEAKRIPVQQGLSIQRQLEQVRDTFTLLHQTHNTPRYRGHIAPR